jgi:hypothetical protein
MSLTKLEAALRKIPFQVPIRYTLVFAALLWIALWSGRIMANAGFGGWIVAFLEWLMAPAIICRLAPRFPIAFGILAAVLSVFSLAVEGSRMYSPPHEIQWQRVPSICISLWFSFALALAFALQISIRVQASRRELSNAPGANINNTDK